MSGLPVIAERLRDAVIRLAGWRRYGLAILAGAIAVLALPPVHFVAALLPAFIVLVWLIDGGPEYATPRRALISAGLAGWCFGIGYFVAGLYWISFSFLVDARTFAWMIPFAVTGLAALLGIYFALVAVLTRLWAPAGPLRVLGFAGFWVGAEWVRGWALTGFPWNLIGTAWTFSDSMIQAAAFGGAYLLSLLTVAAASFPALLGDRNVPLRGRWVWSGAPLVLLAVAWGAGALRLASANTEAVENVRLRLVQPNIAQRDKWRRELLGRHLATLRTLSRRPGSGSAPTHVIWPETAVPFFLDGNRQGVAALAQAAPAGGALISGALRTSAGPRSAAARRRVWNSLAVVTADERIAGSYDKHHLVPFGEYVPLRSVFRIDKITAGRTDFSPGPGLRSIGLPGGPAFSPLICYEAIFPGRAVDGADRPGWLLNLTNDAWFGTSSGPYQHFASTRLRAVEEGLPLVRVANTGISGVVDPYGRIVVRSKLDQTAALDSELPDALSPTFYAAWGNLVPLSLVLIILAAAGAPTRIRRYQKWHRKSLFLL